MNNINKVARYLKAESFPGRAWNGKLNNLNEYLKYLYPLMSTTDQELKDSVFRTYYRHYNDGDFKSDITAPFRDILRGFRCDTPL